MLIIIGGNVNLLIKVFPSPATMLVHSYSRLSYRRYDASFHSSRSWEARSPFFRIRSGLPFSPEKAKFHRELEAAIDVVERACRLCVDVKNSLISSDTRILEKNDQTPVTIADFGVQALISLELGRLFPSIPLVAEEDSSFFRSNSVNFEKGAGTFLLHSVHEAVNDKIWGYDDTLTLDDVLEAIDRGGKNTIPFGSEHPTYWVLDPIDGTRGFLKGNDALYVVGLSLVVEGEIALGILGCPNWKEEDHSSFRLHATGATGSGIIMFAHVGCGTWTRRLDSTDLIVRNVQKNWKRCLVDSCILLSEARYCIPDNHTLESMPLSVLFSFTVEQDRKVVLLPTCCGSLCKYMMVASGRASAFILRAKSQTTIKVWDHAAGVVCIQEAGGKVTDWDGCRLDLEADQAERRVIFPSGGVLVTNSNLHKDLLKILSSSSSMT